MTYVKKEHRRLLKLCDENFVITKEFQKFQSEIEESHNLIIKSKQNQCRCTKCKNTFLCNKKTNSYAKCPYCKNKLLVKTSRLQEFIMKDNLQYIDKIEDYLVIRTFELYSSYDGEKMKHDCTEYMRTIIIDGRGYDFVNDLVHNHSGYMYIRHWDTCSSWRGRSQRWSWQDVRGIVCPYNLKRLFKGTEYQYCCLEKFVKHVGYIDIVEQLKNARSYSNFETLVKNKLYNLASQVNQFRNEQNIKETFKIIKEFLPFIQKHNLTYDELEVLRYSKTPNIRLLRALSGCYRLESLSQVVDIFTSWKRGVLSRQTEYEYVDYLRFARQLGYDMKDKKILYPTHLLEEHDRLANLVEIHKNEINAKLLKQRYDDLKENIYKSRKYIIYPVQSSEELIEESKMQSNCVQTYIERAALAECDIYLMREKSDLEHSLVTIEVRDNQIVQAELKYHEKPTKEHWTFLNRWQEQILNKGGTI